VLELSGGAGCEVTLDCSGSERGRLTALAATRRFGRCVLVGEGGGLSVEVSPMLIHRQLTLFGSWVTSIGRMEELTERLVAWNLRPDVIVTDRLALEDAAEAYRRADAGGTGKVGLVME